MGLWQSIRGLFSNGKQDAKSSLADALNALPPTFRLLHVFIVDRSCSMRDHASQVRELMARHIATLKYSQGSASTAVCIIAFDDEWEMILPPTPVQKVRRPIVYEPDRNTNLYGSVRDIFNQLLTWHITARAQEHPPKTLVTIFCDGEHTPDEKALFARERGEDIPTIIARQHTEVRRASQAMMEHGFDVCVIGYGVSGEKIAIELGLTHEHGFSCDADRAGMDRSMHSTTMHVQKAMQGLALTSRNNNADDDN